MTVTLTQATATLSADDQADRELLESIASETGMNAENLRAFASAWAIGKADVAAVIEAADTGTTAEQLKAGATIARASYAVAHAFRLATGQVEANEAIAAAEPEKVLQFCDFYEAATDSLYIELEEMGDSLERLEVLARLERLSGFWYEARLATGITELLGSEEEA